MSKRIGKHTVAFAQPPVILGTGAVVGPTEGQGPLAKKFDHVYDDLLCGQDSYEKAERELLKNACFTALNKAGVPPQQVDYLLSGDLLNQIISSTFTALPLEIPFLGQYGACSTSAQSLAVGAMLIDGGFAERVLTGCSSHNAAAERQFRYPVEYGSQRKPYAQFTVTGAGAALVGRAGNGVRITHATIGRVMDLGIKDPYNQGAAMAPAAVDTILRHFSDLGINHTHYDLIVTGDLATFGHQMAVQLFHEHGIAIEDRYVDCGMLIYDPKNPEVQSGGSGCGCSAAVTYAHWLPEMLAGRYQRILFVATGALLSTTSAQQGENIPSIAHAVALEGPRPPALPTKADSIQAPVGASTQGGGST